MILNRKGARPSPGGSSGGSPGGPSGGAANKPKDPAPPKVIEIIVGVTITELARKLGVSPEKVEKLMIDLGESPASLEEVVGPDLIELIAMDVGKEAGRTGPLTQPARSVHFYAP